MKWLMMVSPTFPVILAEYINPGKINFFTHCLYAKSDFTSVFIGSENGHSSHPQNSQSEMTSFNNFKTETCDVQLFRNSFNYIAQYNLKTSDVLKNPYEKAVTWSCEIDLSSMS